MNAITEEPPACSAWMCSDEEAEKSAGWIREGEGAVMSCASWWGRANGRLSTQQFASNSHTAVSLSPHNCTIVWLRLFCYHNIWRFIYNRWCFTSWNKVEVFIICHFVIYMYILITTILLTRPSDGRLSPESLTDSQTYGSVWKLDIHYETDVFSVTLHWKLPSI